MEKKHSTILDPGFLVGEVLQHNYSIEECIGEGGTAYVYRATHRVLEGYVAIKVLQRRFAQRSSFRERFLREARLQYQVKHPNIVRVLDFIEEKGLVGCVLEWCNGGELTPSANRLDNLETLLDIREHFFPLLDAMHEVHLQGYVHRDIKPQNILVQYRENQTSWKIGDFGLIKDLSSEHITQSGSIIGTLHYISPEQFEESKSVDHRTDIYSLAVVLYQLLLGRVPFPARMPRLAMQILKAPIPFPMDFPEPLKNVLTQALAKHPDERYSTCLKFKEALERAMDAVVKQGSETSRPHVASLVNSPVQEDVREPFIAAQGTVRSGVTKQYSALYVGVQHTPEEPSVPIESNALLEDGRSVEHLHTVHAHRLGRRWLLRWLLLLLGVGVASYLLLDTRNELSEPQSVIQTFSVRLPVKTYKRLRERALFTTLAQAAEASTLSDWGTTRFSLRMLKSLEQAIYWEAVWTQNTLYALREACKKGFLQACHWSKLAQKKKWTGRRFAKRTLRLYKKACAAHSARACFELGRFPYRIAGFWEPSKERPIWLKKACLMEHSYACIHLGRWWFAQKNPAQAQFFFQKACTLSNSDGCLLWGLVLKQSKTKKGVKKAYIAFEKACSLHDMRGCVRKKDPLFSSP